VEEIQNKEMVVIVVIVMITTIIIIRLVMEMRQVQAIVQGL
jgi:hypothetical protein